jgi:hypothetical protein
VTTFATMQARIADETLRDDLASQIRQSINSAIQTWEGQRFAFNETRWTINTVAGTEYYTMASPTLLTSAGAAVATGELVLELDDIVAVVDSMPYRLCPRTQQYVNEWQDDSFQSQPDSYTIYGDQLRIFPTPDDAYELRLNGLARLGPNPLSSDNDTNGWMTDGEALIRHQAKFLLYRDVIRDKDGMALASEGIKEAEWSLKRKMSAKVMIGHQVHRSL